MTHSDFDIQYARLNTPQREAVDAIEGPVMVIAGPGTGKTQILTLRIANILRQTQVTPANILAITFTSAAATNMKERLSRIIGPQAYATAIYTFHSFCQHVINEHPDDFWDILGARLADDVARIEIIERILDTDKYAHIRPYGKPYFYVTAILGSFSDLKREGVSPSEFQAIVAAEQVKFDATPDKESTRIKGKLKGVFQDWQKQIAKNSELARVYERYQVEMKKADLYDYDDLIMQVLAKLQTDSDFALRLMERYQYVLVDEHQDSNNAQNKILELLMSYHDSPNIFVVGDEKQAIYRFQGASIANFRGFTRLYPTARLITLIDNYRSTQSILDSALSLLPSVTDQQLTAHTKHTDQPIHVVDLVDEQSMLTELARRVSDVIAHGTRPEEIAILLRTNKHVKLVTDQLKSAGIAVYASSSQNIFETTTIDRLMRILKAVHQYGDESALAALLTVDFLAFDPLVVYKTIQAARSSRIGLADLLSEQSQMEKIAAAQGKAMYEFFVRLGTWAMLAHNTDIHTLLHTIVKESGLLTHLAKSTNPIESVAPLRLLYDTIAALDPDAKWRLVDFFTYYDKIVEHGVRLPVQLHVIPTGKVQVLTAHASKGLEFDHVFIPYTQERVWGGKGRASLFKLPDSIYGASEEGGEDDETRRLFFVALTRARAQATILFSRHDSAGEVILPTVYIAEIEPRLKTEETIEVHPALVQTQEVLKKKTPDDRERFLDFVHGSFMRYGLSVSAVNNYLEDPWKYFYVNLVRIPQGKSETLMYGNAIHNALSYFFMHYKDTGECSLDYLLNAFEISAKKEWFSKDELARALERGREHLRGYYTHYEDSLPRNVRVKLRIKTALPSSVVPGQDPGSSKRSRLDSSLLKDDQRNPKSQILHPQENFQSSILHSQLPSGIPLNGELDLLEYLDASSKRVAVRDFKTGKPKSRGEVMGETKDGDGNYYRQLVFYKLLLKLHSPDTVMQSGMIDFVQADDKGGYHQEIFEIEDGEVSELETTISRISHEILTLAFWDTPCAPDSDWYPYWEALHKKEFVGGLF